MATIDQSVYTVTVTIRIRANTSAAAITEVEKRLNPIEPRNDAYVLTIQEVNAKLAKV